MSTVQLKLGPRDHGRELSLEEYESADYELGSKYEIIDGALYVSPEPNFAESFLEVWLSQKLHLYRFAHPEIINYITVKSRVFVPDRAYATVPEPDIAAFRGIPLDADLRDIHWQDLSPILVAEVLVDADPAKDLRRNPVLFLAVPTIAEYWVLDGRDNANEPALIQHRRDGDRWVIHNYPYGTMFTTNLLPDFQLVIDPRK